MMPKRRLADRIALLAGARRLGLPRAAHLAQEAVASWRVLLQHGVAAVAVEPDRAGAQQHAGRLLGAGHRVDHGPRAVAAALEDRRALRGRPAAGGGLAGEVDDGGGAGHVGRRDARCERRAGGSRGPRR